MSKKTKRTYAGEWLTGIHKPLRKVWEYIADHADKDAITRLTEAEIAEGLNSEERWIHRHVYILRLVGILRVHDDGFICLEPVGDVDPEEVFEDLKE